MRILITGYPGWISSELVRRFRSSDRILGHTMSHLRCLVEPGRSLSEHGLDVVEGDLTRPDGARDAVRDIDLIIHCAGIIHPTRIRQLYEVNRDGTRHLLALAREAGVKRFLFLSTNSVQGFCPSPGALLSENGHGTPGSHYARSKWEAEQILRDPKSRGGVETVILRPSTFYGPGLPARMQRVYHMVRGGRPVVFGRGQNRISMCYLDNLVQAIEKAATHPAAAGQTYFVSDERPYKVVEILQAIAGAFSTPLRPRFVPSAISTVSSWADSLLSALGVYWMDLHVAGEMNQEIAVSIEKAGRQIGYQPTVALEEGVRRTVQWGRQAGVFPS